MPDGRFRGLLGARLQAGPRLLVAFVLAYTIVFASLAAWLYSTSTSMTVDRLVQQLQDAAVGGAQTVDADALDRLYRSEPAVLDPDAPSGHGYPDSPLYGLVAKQLYGIYLIAQQANPYTYFRDPEDGELYFGVSAGYMLSPPVGVTYKVPVRGWVNDETYALMEEGLTQTVNQGAYTDVYGSWISTYTPLRTSDGRTVGALGVDYPLDYVTTVQQQVTRRMYPTIALTYLLLLALLIAFGATITRPLRRLAAAVRRLRMGDYDLDLDDVAATRFPREVHVLATEVVALAHASRPGDRSRSGGADVGAPL